jgi:uncharacterized membrane protein
MSFDTAMSRPSILRMAVGGGAGAAPIGAMPAARETSPAPANYEIRKAKLRDILEVLVRGYEDARASRSGALATAAIYPITAILLGGVVATQALLPFVFPICAGFALLGPLATLWFVALSRERDRTGVVSAAGAARVFNSPRNAVIKRLAGVTVALYLAWIAVAGVIYGATLGTSPEHAGAPFFDRVFTTDAGWTMAVVGCLVGALFALVALAIGCISFPMAIDRDVTARQAIGASVRAVLHNPVLALAWGAVVVAGLILGAIPVLLGLGLILPVLGHANWHLYRKLIG